MSTAALPRFSKAVVVMGVASCGKTTIGEALARHLEVPFVEGDSLHGAANVEKMSAGIPLTDEDRWPWLSRVGQSLSGEGGAVGSCSALKRRYREAIAKSAGKDIYFIHLHGSAEVLRERIESRKGHFMPASLLASQLATLEIPTADEQAITINIDQEPDAIVAQALAFLRGESS